MTTNITNNNTTTASFPILGVLGIAFIVMKLGGWGAVATWSWWWVLAPFWIPFLVLIVIIVIALIVLGIAHLLDK